MARITIKTRNHGEVTFGVNDAGGYVRVYGHPTIKDGAQICDGGLTMGETVMGSEKSLDSKARRWWSQWLRNQREMA